jgi:hypothetical protein
MTTKQELWQEYMKKEPSAITLHYLSRDKDEEGFIREEAFKALLEHKDLDEFMLRILVVYHPEFRDRAWTKLKQMKPGENDLGAIYEKVPELRQEIDEIIETTPQKILVEIRGT